MRFVLLLALVACAHVTPKATVLGKRVGVGELTGSDEVKTLMREALAERFELDDKAELHLHVEGSLNSFDETVFRNPSLGLQSTNMQAAVQRVQTLKVTIRLVEDASGTEKAVGMYELQEKGAERPRNSQANDDLGVVLTRRAVRAFIDEHKL
ncbi:MAG: hypothetical protein JNK82_41610 [Myxococcaceae bacterium]|nr:hypothetical protein [Myxococcaceae bacterium]